MQYEIRDPIYGYVTFDDDDKKLIDTPEVQRLHRILQLAAAYVAYPGATHTRFEHSIGTMHVATMIAESLKSDGLAVDNVKKIRFSGLLHDLGHGPFSHSFEYALKRKKNLNHEEITAELIKRTEIADTLSALGFKPEEIADVVQGHDQLLSAFVAGQVDADKIDFLLRDSLHAGVDYGRFDWQRLIRSFHVQGKNVYVSTNSLYALESFLIARFQMFRAVYYHKTVRAADLMLERAIFELWDLLDVDSFDPKKSPERYLELDDYTAYSKLKSAAENKPNSTGSRLFFGLARRDLLKMAYEKRIMGGKEAIISRPQDMEAEICQESGLEDGNVFVDTPYLTVIPLSASNRIEIDVWDEGSGHPEPLSNLSNISKSLMGYYEPLRVYTFKEHRETVNKAASRILGEGSELHYRSGIVPP
ncbi:HD domain-containing protein [Tardisphaera miroshnichenkoae]